VRWRPTQRTVLCRPRQPLDGGGVDTKGAAFEVKKVAPLFGPVTTGYDVSADARSSRARSPEVKPADR